MVVGTLGNIKFQISKDKALLLRSVSRNISASYQTHDTIGTKPKSEFVKPELRTVNIEIYLSANLGVKPRRTLDIIANKVENGEAEYLIIGGKPLAKNRFVIKSVGETWGVIYSKGELASCNVSLSLEEYV